MHWWRLCSLEFVIKWEESDSAISVRSNHLSESSTVDCIRESSESVMLIFFMLHKDVIIFTKTSERESSYRLLFVVDIASELASVESLVNSESLDKFVNAVDTLLHLSTVSRWIDVSRSLSSKHIRLRSWDLSSKLLCLLFFSFTFFKFFLNRCCWIEHFKSELMFSNDVLSSAFFKFSSISRIKISQSRSALLKDEVMLSVMWFFNALIIKLSITTRVIFVWSYLRAQSTRVRTFIRFKIRARFSISDLSRFTNSIKTDTSLFDRSLSHLLRYRSALIISSIVNNSIKTHKLTMLIFISSNHSEFCRTSSSKYSFDLLQSVLKDFETSEEHCAIFWYALIKFFFFLSSCLKIRSISLSISWAINTVLSRQAHSSWSLSVSMYSRSLYNFIHFFSSESRKISFVDHRSLFFLRSVLDASTSSRSALIAFEVSDEDFESDRDDKSLKSTDEDADDNINWINCQRLSLISRSKNCLRSDVRFYSNVNYSENVLH